MGVSVMYKLTSTQREVLEALVKLYEQHRRLIKSVEIAELVKKDEGTVRNVISSLRSLGLLESKTGPSGGYIPTLKAIELVKMPPLPSYGLLKIWKGGRETNVTAFSMEIIDVLNPEGGKALLRVGGNIEELNEGDEVKVGPTPYMRLVIEGTIHSIDKLSGQVSVLIKRMVSIPREPVGNIASKKLITVSPKDLLKDIASFFTKQGIRGAPVVSEGKIVGIITTTDIARAYSEGNLKATVEEYMKKNVITIREDEDILDAIKLMDLYGVGRLVVVSAVGEPVGIVTRTDVLRRLSAIGK